jgi:excisionase family DNA binding protein
MEKLLTTKQAARILNITVLQVYHFIKTGMLKAYKLGGNGSSKRHWRIKESDLNNFIEGETINVDLPSPQ